MLMLHSPSKYEYLLGECTAGELANQSVLSQLLVDYRNMICYLAARVMSAYEVGSVSRLLLTAPPFQIGESLLRLCILLTMSSKSNGSGLRLRL